MYLNSPTIDEILSAFKQLNPQDDEVVILLLGEALSISIDNLIYQLKQTEYKFVGGIFPSIISPKTHDSAGVILKTIPVTTEPYLIHELDQQINLPDFEEELDISEEKQLTALVLIDGLTSQISNFLAELYNTMGNSVRYLGGGAGSLSLKQQPCIFTHEGCFQDAAAILFIPLESKLGVKHGWQRLKGPFPATKVHANTITELNWRNAFEVYKEAVEEDSQKVITQENFFEIAKGYPFGIFKENQEDIVRDPIIVNDAGELICVGEVPENALLYILKGEKESLVTSAQQAAEESRQEVEGRLYDFLVVDCISRVLFLEDDFSKEIAALQAQLIDVNQSRAVEGALTLGEISSYGEGFLEFFNKTIVVGALCRES